jgi:hypothetical protein
MLALRMKPMGWRLVEGRAVRETLFEFRPDDSVIGGPGDSTWSHIDFGGMAARGHHARGQYIVDAPAEVPLEGVAEEIPACVLNYVRV